MAKKDKGKDKGKGKGRDCGTGRYVKRSKVKKSPKTTVTEKPKKKDKNDIQGDFSFLYENIIFGIIAFGLCWFFYPFLKHGRFIL